MKCNKLVKVGGVNLNKESKAAAFDQAVTSTIGLMVHPLACVAVKEFIRNIL